MKSILGNVLSRSRDAGIGFGVIDQDRYMFPRAHALSRSIAATMRRCGQRARESVATAK